MRCVQFPTVLIHPCGLLSHLYIVVIIIELVLIVVAEWHLTFSWNTEVNNLRLQVKIRWKKHINTKIRLVSSSTKQANKHTSALPSVEAASL